MSVQVEAGPMAAPSPEVVARHRSTRPQLPTLTFLRFLAAISVVVYHVGHYVPGMSWMLVWSGLAYVSVTFFFILSGFVLAWRHQVGQRPTVFWWRRVVRVMPLYLTACVWAGLLGLLGGRQWPGADSVLRTVLLVQSWSPRAVTHFAVNPVNWSLSVEAFFYLIFPVLMAAVAVSRHRLLWLAPAVLMIVVVAAIEVMQGAGVTRFFYTAPWFHLAEFLIGVMLAVAMRTGFRMPVTLPGALALCGSVWLYLQVRDLESPDGTLLADVTQHTLPFHLVTALFVVPIVVLIAAAAQRDLGRQQGEAGPGDWMVTPRMLHLGEWAFALYLLHCPIVKLLGAHSDGWPFPVTLVASALVVVASLWLARLAHTRVERPMASWLRPMVTQRR